MRKFNFFIAFFCFRICNAQTPQPLLRREAFDFEVGDEFHYEVFLKPDIVNTINTTESFMTDVVLSKVVLSDSFVYEVKRISKSRYMRPVSHIFDTITYSIVYDKLDSAVSTPNLITPFHNNILIQNICPAPCDTNNYIDSTSFSPTYLSKLTTKVKSEFFIINRVTYVKNLGIVDYFNSADLSFGRDQKTIKLMYYKSAQNGDEWGSKLNMVGMEQMTKETSFNYFPNPVVDKLSIIYDFLSNSSNLLVSVFSLDGRLVYSTNINERKTLIDLKNLESGCYSLYLNDASSDFSKRTLIIKK